MERSLDQYVVQVLQVLQGWPDDTPFKLTVVVELEFHSHEQQGHFPNGGSTRVLNMNSYQ